MRYFKIKYGFSPEDTIKINENELEKAIYCHLKGITGIFDKGTVSGRNIIAITEDWHTAMNYNDGHKLGAEDFEHINQKLGNSYQGVIAEARSRVQQYISEGKENLVGSKPLETIEFKQGGTNSIGDILKQKNEDTKSL